jgi:hypothetical protein
VPGFLDSVNITLDTNVGWEIMLQEYTEDDVAQLPFVVNISCGFKPIMDILPRRESYEQNYVPLIANTGFLKTGIDNPDGSATNKAQSEAAQQIAAQEAVAAGRASALASSFREANPITTGNLLGGKYAVNNSQPAPKKPITQGNNPVKPKALDTSLFKFPTKAIQDNTSFNPTNAGGTFKAGGG